MAEFSQQFAFGIDIGGTNTKYGVVDSGGAIVQKGELKTADYPEVEHFIEALFDVFQPFITDHGAGQVKGVGVGAPNANFYTGAIDNAFNLPWKGVIPLSQLINNKFGLPAIVTKDSSAAALGEMTYGAARGMDDFIMITLGTGVGSGIVANGRLIYGHDGNAGELGHTTIRTNGRKHWVTNIKGSVESYCSAKGLVITAREFLQNEGKDSLLRKYGEKELNATVINQCADEGDELARDIYRYTGEILGEALANFCMFSSPEAVILFGGVVKAGDFLLKPTRESMERNLLPVFQNKIKLIVSELEEANAAILGAAAMVEHYAKHGGQTTQLKKNK